MSDYTAEDANRDIKTAKMEMANDRKKYGQIQAIERLVIWLAERELFRESIKKNERDESYSPF